MARKPKILEVSIVQSVDTDPDSSWLGEYERHQPAGWYADRKECKLYDGAGNVLADSLFISSDDIRRELQFIGGFQHNGTAASWSHIDDKGVGAAYLHVRYRNNGRPGRRYQRNGFVEFGIIGWDVASTRAAKIRCIDAFYCACDVYRLESLNRGDWCFVGIAAKCEVQLPNSNIVQNLTSGGLWGIESDSDDAYLVDIETEQLAELRGELESVGCSDRQVKQAFKTVSHVER